MDQQELAQIREQRMAELRNNSNGGGGQEEEKAAAREDMRRGLLSQILEPSARERLNTISIVKPEKSKSVEDLILRMAQSGRLQKRLSEKDIIDLLSQMSSEEQMTRQNVVIQRRRYSDDEDDFGL